MFYGIFIVSLISVFIGFAIDSNGYKPDSDLKPNIVLIILTAISAVLFAPVLEELLFRGIIMEGYIENYG